MYTHIEQLDITCLAHDPTKGVSCQKWNGTKMAPHTTFSRKKWNGVPPKMAPLRCQFWLLNIHRLLCKSLTTQFEAKEFLVLTFAQQQNHSSYLQLSLTPH